jgi:hypothetical protein
MAMPQNANVIEMIFFRLMVPPLKPIGLNKGMVVNASPKDKFVARLVPY